VAQVAETVLGDDRLIVRRVRNLDDQGELFFDWRFHAFVTNRPATSSSSRPTIATMPWSNWRSATSRRGRGSNTVPRGRFHANGAWLVLTALADHVVR
jgi:hypothetical protein